MEALGVEQETYSALVVLSLLEELPEQLRLTITRVEDHHECNLEQLWNLLGREVELEEEYNRNTQHTRSPQDELKKELTLHTGKQANYQNCACCIGGYKHEEWQKVNDINERKQISISLVVVLVLFKRDILKTVELM